VIPVLKGSLISATRRRNLPPGQVRRRVPMVRNMGTSIRGMPARLQRRSIKPLSQMPQYDFRSPRLYVDAPLHKGADVALERAQAHYLGNVLRLKSGDRVLAFNGRDGEWAATL